MVVILPVMVVKMLDCQIAITWVVIPCEVLMWPVLVPEINIPKMLWVVTG